MKNFRKVIAAVAMVFAFNFAANAQTADDDNDIVADASVSEVSEVQKTDIVEIKVWPKVSAFKVNFDIEERETVKVFNIAGIMVKEEELNQGESLNIESLMPGSYIVMVGDKKKGTFVRK